MSTRSYGGSGKSSSAVMGPIGLWTIWRGAFAPKGVPHEDKPATRSNPPPLLRAATSSTSGRSPCERTTKSTKRRAQHGVGVLRREVAAPDDRDPGPERLERLAHADGLRQLRSRHDRNGQQRGPESGCVANAAADRRGRVGREVAVHERPGDPVALEHGGQRQQRQRQRLLARRGRDRIEEDDHRATHTPNAAGDRPKRQRAI